MSTSRLLFVAGALASVAPLPACTGGGTGRLDFSDGICREHGEVFDCSPLGETCGCAEGEACRPQFDGSRLCVTVGTAAEGEACEASAECESGTWCVLGQCSAFCDLRPGGLGCPGSVCSDAAGEEEFPFGACVHDGCDPVYGGGCGTGPGCSLVHFANDTESVAVCYEVGPGTHGDPCDVEKCASGHVCLRSQVGGILRCVRLCVPGDDLPCAEVGAVSGCIGRFEQDTEVDGRTLGYCAG